jgi:tricarballylate dehydrogenase
VSESTGNSGYDVIVVGGGNAGFSAAHAAREQGASVLVLEKTSVDTAGGNSFYTAGAFRFAFDSIDDLVPLLDDATIDRLPSTVVPPYPESDFADDMVRVTDGKCDPVLTEELVSHSADTMQWLHDKGLEFRLMYERQSFEKNGVYTFFGGLVVGSVGGGKGLIAQHTKAALDSGIEILYDSKLTAIRQDDAGTVIGVTYSDKNGVGHDLDAPAVVLAAGGFEANPAMRKTYLGDGWERAIVRGNPSNTGEVLEMALELGAEPYGDWTSCHSVAWDAGGPPNGGDRKLTNQMTRQSYPLGIVVNKDGKRFVDEGADYRNYTYAKYGREILKQPEGIAFQLFDAKTRPLLRTEEYDSYPISETISENLEDLEGGLKIAPGGLVATVRRFNESIVDEPFDPAIKDGRAALTEPPKSNWALALDSPPYYAYAVSCGITFTFGGVHVTTKSEVLSSNGVPIPGLFAAGEMVGGLFSGNYPGGSGLTAGAVFGRAAGTSAAARAKSAGQ